MAISSDTLLERLHLRRRVTFWRLLTISIAIFFGVLYFEGKENSSPITGDYIARVTIDGIIEDDKGLRQLLKDVEKDESAKALILWMNTPGGTTLGGETVHDLVQKIKKKKPVVVVMRTLCASAGYMIAVAGDHLIAGKTTLTGSIGVLMQSAELTGLADKLGIQPIIIKSGPNKAAPSFIEKFTPEQREVLEGTLNDSFLVFKEMVAEGRDMPMEKVEAIADGRIYTGREAFKLGMIDALGGEEEAISWLRKEKKISSEAAVRDMKRKKEGGGVWQRLLDNTGLAKAYTRSLQLDGLLSIWQPAL